MLTKESSKGFSPAPDYPTYEYINRSGRGKRARCDRGRIVPTPKGFREIIEFHNEDEHFADYLGWIEDEHKDKPDSLMSESPYGIFIGTWRNARWYDEAQRRGLIKEVKS